ncbi:MAG: Holliday junction branch migration protein RuvA [Clostridia bacterium]|jgi:Holliday junction DNA helicase RuvA|nr:Holliday junction branch migration protein RuvA [Clostridia bacterium]
MFDYITGRIARVDDGRIVIDCNGVGFLLSASAYACAEYSRKPEATVPVYLAVREDAMELYGFTDDSERALFLQLIGVSGVGAKLAMSILGGMPADRLVSAIGRGDIALLSSIKGVGKKTAERIALELKGKVAPCDDTAAPEPVEELDGNAVSALVGLGFDRREAEAAVRRVQGSCKSTEDIIRAVLKG